jgi:hypothetical protein
MMLGQLAVLLLVLVDLRLAQLGFDLIEALLDLLELVPKSHVLLFGRLLVLGVLLSKPVDPPGCVHEALLARVEGMAVGTDFNFDVLAPGGGGSDLKTTGASNLRCVELGMHVLFHEFLPVVLPLAG